MSSQVFSVLSLTSYCILHKLGVKSDFQYFSNLCIIETLKIVSFATISFNKIWIDILLIFQIYWYCTKTTTSDQLCFFIPFYNTECQPIFKTKQYLIGIKYIWQWANTNLFTDYISVGWVPTCIVLYLKCRNLFNILITNFAQYPTIFSQHINLELKNESIFPGEKTSSYSVTY